MIAPLMRQKLTYKQPGEGRDDYGRPIVSEVEKSTKCRVQYKKQYIRTADGSTREVTAEVDTPPGIVLEEGTEISFTDQEGIDRTGTIESATTALNFSGSRIIYKTFYVGNVS